MSGGFSEGPSPGNCDVSFEGDEDPSLGEDGVFLEGNEDLPVDEYDVLLVAAILGTSEEFVLELHEMGELPPPCSVSPVRWKGSVIEPWICDNLSHRVLLAILFGFQHFHLSAASEKSEQAGGFSDPGIDPDDNTPWEETRGGLFPGLESPGLEGQIGDVYRFFGLGEVPGSPVDAEGTGFVDDFEQKMLGSSRMSVPVEGNASMAQFLPPPPGGSFPWDDWTQRTTPFLWTLADVAHALKISLSVTEKMHAQGHLPPEMWSDPPLWEGHVMQPWVRDTLRDANKLGRALVASQQQEEKNLGPVEGHEVEDTLVAFGLLGLRGLARRVGKDLTTLRQWYHDGCPACPMPYPDVRAVGLETGREEPYWFTDGQIRDWLAQVNSGKPVASGSKLDRTQPTNTPYGQKEKRGVMGKIYDRLRQDFDTTLTVMSAGEASLKDLAEDFPRVLSLAASLDAPVEKIVPLADRLTQARLLSAFELDAETLRRPSAVGVFARGIRGVRLTRTGAIETATADLAEALRSPLLPSPSSAHDFFRFQKAYALMYGSLYNVAAAEFDSIAVEGGLWAEQAEYWRTELTVTAKSHFRDALSASAAIGDNGFLAIRKHLLRGNIHRKNARFAEAETEYMQARDLARQARADGLEDRAIMNLAETLAWTRPQEGHRLALDAIERARKQNNKVDELRAWLALAIADTGTQAEATVQDHIQKATELDQLLGGQIGQIPIGTVQAFQAVITGNSDILHQACKTVTSTTRMLGTDQFQNDILAVWSGMSSTEQSRRARETQWLDGPDETLRRWREVVTARQDAA